MILLALSIPFAFLCLHLSFLTWRRRFRRHAIVLAFFALFFFGLALISFALTALSYLSLRAPGSISPPV